MFDPTQHFFLEVLQVPNNKHSPAKQIVPGRKACWNRAINSITPSMKFREGCWTAHVINVKEMLSESQEGSSL